MDHAPDQPRPAFPLAYLTAMRLSSSPPQQLPRADSGLPVSPRKPPSVSMEESRSSNLPAPERAVACFTTKQISAVEGDFRHHQYRGLLDGKRLAREMPLCPG
ncbi:hypothetical protein P7K49_027559 [Saguinus oedipus]|uniref:Uncharacterized protein n=1 Tax=Saguinus oedipus TaxID=9490 RepID=A0ABQ9U9T7_SAGOE|nr:hypothetical protein P7K49_027559 [Saguinus oedipus]